MLTAIAHSASAQDGDYLLKTHWRQDGPFAQFTPGNELLGCWSTAYAQILYYHRLSPTGRVDYKCTSGQRVDVDLGAMRFNWDRFALDATEAADRVEQAALYSYAVAGVVRKDFGTGTYLRLLNSTPDLEAHFPVDAEMYLVLADNQPLASDDRAQKLRSEKVDHLLDGKAAANLVEREIAAKRPVYLHFGNMTDFGHSTVIDGFRRVDGRTEVHLNYGAAELEKTAWYDLFAPITQPDDLTLRAFVTIRPKIAAPTGDR